LKARNRWYSRNSGSIAEFGGAPKDVAEIAGSSKISGEGIAEKSGDEGGGVSVRLVIGAKSGAATAAIAGAEVNAEKGAATDSESGMVSTTGSGSGSVSEDGITG
jgi:hypothetical protein